jgi:hypothetical protein
MYHMNIDSGLYQFSQQLFRCCIRLWMSSETEAEFFEDITSTWNMFAVTKFVEDTIMLITFRQKSTF